MHDTSFVLKVKNRICTKIPLIFNIVKLTVTVAKEDIKQLCECYDKLI